VLAVTLFLAFLFVTGLTVAWAPGRASDDPVTVTVVGRYRGELASTWARRYRERGVELRKARADVHRRWHPTVLYALRLASTVYGVPYRELHAVGSCESHLYAFARNGRYRGVFQEGPMFERGPFASFGVFDPIANALTAAYTVSHEGWRQWSCRP
jgi:hypothetical protein